MKNRKKQNQSDLKQTGSSWFRRLRKEMLAFDSNLRFVPIRHGFFRIYWKTAYIGECYKDMPLLGYDIEDLNIHVVESKQYAMDKMVDGEIQRKVKNFIEGYVDAKDKVLSTLYKVKHDKEAYDTASKGFSGMKIK